MREGPSGQLPVSTSIPDDVLWRKVDDEIVLVDLAGGRYHRLDDVGTRMWEALDETGTVALARRRLLEVYDVEPEVLERDLAGFVARLVDSGLLTARY
ncbi:MAG: PqqD family protein [Solirubrobacteraceae bacterium]